MQTRLVTTLAGSLLVISAVGVSAQSPAATMAPMGSMAVASMAPSGSMTPGAIDSPAADLRTALDLKLGEHIILALKATDAALAGQTDPFQAYGEAAQHERHGHRRDDRQRLWPGRRGHLRHDLERPQRLLRGLHHRCGHGRQGDAGQGGRRSHRQYVPDFSKFISDATGLPLDAVTSLITDHVLQTKDVVDAQAAKDWPKAYAGIRTAYAHMQMIGDALAGSIVAKFPDLLEGINRDSSKGPGVPRPIRPRLAPKLSWKRGPLSKHPSPVSAF